MGRGDLADDLRGAVIAAVVHDENFDRVGLLPEVRNDPLQRLGQSALFIIRRNDDRQVRSLVAVDGRTPSTFSAASYNEALASSKAYSVDGSQLNSFSRQASSSWRCDWIARRL